MRCLTITIIILLLLSLTACSGPSEKKIDIEVKDWDQPYDSCMTDDDCICKGVHPDGDQCFIGNREYYDAFVDPDIPCPVKGYCEGPYGNMVIKCVGKCVQMPK